jgi:hypothetical protein
VNIVRIIASNYKNYSIRSRSKSIQRSAAHRWVIISRKQSMTIVLIISSKDISLWWKTWRTIRVRTDTSRRCWKGRWRWRRACYCVEQPSHAIPASVTSSLFILHASLQVQILPTFNTQIERSQSTHLYTNFFINSHSLYWNEGRNHTSTWHVGLDWLLVICQTQRVINKETLAVSNLPQKTFEVEQLKTVATVQVIIPCCVKYIALPPAAVWF